jgi:DNA adenine methylase
MTPLVADILRANKLVGGIYVEPFAGGCGVAWALLLSDLVSEVWINDIDPAIYAFWRCVLSRTEELVERIESTPVTISEWHAQREIYRSGRASQLDLGFATLFLNRTNRSGILSAGVIGGLAQAGNYKLDCRFTKSETIRKIRSIARFRCQVRLSRRDAASFLAQDLQAVGMRSLINIDPPYYSKGPDLYCSHYTHDDHVELAQQIRALRQPWILTYDDADPIRRIYARRKVRELSLVYFAQVKRVGVELLYSSARLRLPDSAALAA